MIFSYIQFFYRPFIYFSALTKQLEQQKQYKGNNTWQLDTHTMLQHPEDSKPIVIRNNRTIPVTTISISTHIKNPDSLTTTPKKRLEITKNTTSLEMRTLLAPLLKEKITHTIKTQHTDIAKYIQEKEKLYKNK